MKCNNQSLIIADESLKTKTKLWWIAVNIETLSDQAIQTSCHAADEIWNEERYTLVITRIQWTVQITENNNMLASTLSPMPQRR